MLSLLVARLRIPCLAVALGFAALLAAEPPHPLIGSNQEQVIRKLGEPRSQLVTGNRLVLLYARERIILRDGVVVNVEQVPVEPVRRAPSPAPVPAPAPAPGAVAPAGESAPASGTVPAPPAATPVAPAPAVPAPVAPLQPPPAAEAAPAGKAAPGLPRVEPAPAPEPEPKIEIKLVRPPSAGELGASSRSSPPTATAPARPTPPTVVPAVPASPSVASPPPESAVRSPAPPAAEPAVGGAPAAQPIPPGMRAPVATQPAPTVAPALELEKPEEVAGIENVPDAAAKAKKKADLIKASRRRLQMAQESAAAEGADEGIPTSTVVIALAVIAGGVGLLVWRRRQHQAELEISAVRELPATPAAALGQRGRTSFSAETLVRLEWKRFQEVVEAYYSKTGVVAERTKSGPASAVHIKISWKGEPRPFACVRCIAPVDGLIQTPALEELATVLESEDIRRGYVVTTGRFSVEARDFAEKKHLTLLPGDILLEKINAMPESARLELLQVANAGDPETPSCPVCEAKMSRSKEGPPVWRCASHPNQTFPVK